MSSKNFSISSMVEGGKGRKSHDWESSEVGMIGEGREGSDRLGKGLG